MRSALFPPFALLVTSSPALGQAQAPALPRVAQLEYVLAPGAKSCPPEPVFRSAVGGQVDRPVFVAGAPARMRVVLSRRPRGGHYEAALDLIDAAGALLLHQTTPPADRCTDVVQAAAVMVAETLDPTRLEPPPLPSPPAVVVAEPAPPPPAPEPSPWEGHAGLGSWLGLGVAPRPAAGLAADVGLRWSPISLSAELRWDPPAGADAGGGARLSTWRLLGAVVPCGHWSPRESFGLFGCAVVQVGKIWGKAENVPASITIGEPYFAAGGRFGVELRLTPITPHLGLRLSGDLLANIQRTKFVIHGQPPWTTPRLAGDVGLGVVAFW